MKPRYGWGIAIVAAVLGPASIAHAGPVSIMVGDDDGYGVAVPDNGALPFTNPPPIIDNRSLAEAAASDGAQLTDLYSATSPFGAIGFSPNPASVSVLFPFAGSLSGATLTIDMGDFQAEEGGQQIVSFNGVVQPSLFNFQDGFQVSVVRSFVLSPAAIANANAVNAFILGIDSNDSGDLTAYDYFRLDGDASTSGPEASVPEPTTLLLLGSGLALLRVAKTRCGRRSL